ncbi:MAG: hypothetical protein QNJ40_10680 [Xanthomonadales bacterium]|nr:hypothetical protein [Xanthomonadales bacterium]
MSVHRELIILCALMLAPQGSTQPVFIPEWPRVGPYSAADMCSNCHDATDVGVEPAIMRAPDPALPSVPDPDGHNISPMLGQKAGVMGHTMNDPYFTAVVDDEVSYFPDLDGQIENECLRCHAPMGFDYAHGYNPAALDEDGYYRLDTAVSEMHAREGVSCTLCHQIQIDPNVELANGTRIVGDDSILFGPIADPVRTRMARYGVEYSEAISDSALCGSCHNLFTIVLNPDTGDPTGERFLEQGSWFEWRNSVFAEGGGTTCQDCHMATPGVSFQTPVSTYNAPPARAGYSPHLNPGGNTQLLEMLRQYRIDLGLDPLLTDGEFQVAMETTQEYLKQAAALLLAVDGRPGVLIVDATILNLTGHKLPTGYPARRMWLHMRVTDDAGATVFESGAPDPDGRLPSDAAETAAACTAQSKPDGFDSAVCYSPHRDLIDDPDQVAVYESVMSDANDNITYVLLSGRGYLKDNRIPPVGFTASGEHFLPETAVVGIGSDADFNVDGSGQDTVHYRVPVIDTDGPFTVEARLLYQSVRPAFVSVLTADTQRVNDYRSYYVAVPPQPELLAEASAVAAIEIVFFDGFEIGP